MKLKIKNKKEVHKMRGFLFVYLLIYFVLAEHRHDKKKKPVKSVVNHGREKSWATLKGGRPVVIAKGGFPVLFPDSSEIGYTVAVERGVPDVIRYCNLQLTKDSLGVCLADMKLDNCTNAATKYPKQQQKYNVNGQDVDGWFTIDFSINQMGGMSLMQNIPRRTRVFDSVYPPMPTDAVFSMNPNVKSWLNVQYDAFWTKHNLSAIRFIEDSKENFVADYISSPEISFLKAMGASPTFDKKTTKLIFRFPSPDEVEPATMEKYNSFLGKLATIKTFASGILVPKDYIWPVDNNGYLQPATTLVADAHKEGLEVYASGFTSDAFFSFNYSFDPAAEYLQFVDNSQFSVDGILSENPGAASSAIACLAHSLNATTKVAKALVISHNGASIDFPGCTDLAYKKAINDGADMIDCNVQMTRDGVAFCLDSSDLIGKTTAAMSVVNRSTSISDIQPNNGIFSFDLTWSEIQSVKPLISSPFFVNKDDWHRNPELKNAGKLVTLPEFLDLAKENATTGVLIGIQNAAYLASKKGLNIVDTVIETLKNATMDTKQQILIQSDDTSVLSKFKDVATTYKRVLLINEPISDAPKPVVAEVKKYADAVNLVKKSIIESNTDRISTVFTSVVQEMHAANISVYVSGFSTECQTMIVDFYCDPYTELATFLDLEIDGVITDNPKTASAFMRNPCADQNNMALPFAFRPIKVGNYLGQVQAEALSPAEAPVPPLEAGDIADPPLPAVNTSVAVNNSDLLPVAEHPFHQSPASLKSAANDNLSVATTMLLIHLLS